MTWAARSTLRASACAFMLLCLPHVSPSQWFRGNLTDTTNHADYILVTPVAYVDVVQPLAAFRAGNQSLAVMVVLLDSITSQFPRATPDSSIRDLVTRSLLHWRTPRPRFLLLAGNVNAIPSHQIASQFWPHFSEDSVMVDQWFASQLTETALVPVPEIAVGRLPAWNREELVTMVGKTLAYEQAVAGPWASRSIVVADSTDQTLFESYASMLQEKLALRWSDTITVHVRTNSPAFRTREEFRQLWNEGSAIINLAGHASGEKFSPAHYFTSKDVDSLASGSPLPLFLLLGPQRFEEADSVCIAVALMQASDRGAVCTIAPSGLMYLASADFFQSFLADHLAQNPGDPIGPAWVAALHKEPTRVNERWTLLGDPAVVIKSRTVTTVKDPDGTAPGQYVLLQNFPNPFNPSTTIRFGLPGRAQVTLTVYNTLGQQVALLVNSEMAEGYHEVRFDGSDLPSGVYFYRLQAGTFADSRRLVLLR